MRSSWARAEFAVWKVVCRLKRRITRPSAAAGSKREPCSSLRRSGTKKYRTEPVAQALNGYHAGEAARKGSRRLYRQRAFNHHTAPSGSPRIFSFCQFTLAWGSRLWSWKERLKKKRSGNGKKRKLGSIRKEVGMGRKNGAPFENISAPQAVVKEQTLKTLRKKSRVGKVLGAQNLPAAGGNLPATPHLLVAPRYPGVRAGLRETEPIRATLAQVLCLPPRLCACEIFKLFLLHRDEEWRARLAASGKRNTRTPTSS